MNNCLNCVCTPDDSGMPCINGFTCVVQDEFWSQCIGEMALLRGGFTMRTSGHVRMWLKTTHTHTHASAPFSLYSTPTPSLPFPPRLQQQEAVLHGLHVQLGACVHRGRRRRVWALLRGAVRGRHVQLDAGNSTQHAGMRPRTRISEWGEVRAARKSEAPETCVRCV